MTAFAFAAFIGLCVVAGILGGYVAGFALRTRLRTERQQVAFILILTVVSLAGGTAILLSILGRAA